MTGKQPHTGSNDGACFIVNGEQSSVWQQTKGQRTTIHHESRSRKADPEFWWRWRETYRYIGHIFCQDILKQACLETPYRGPHMCIDWYSIWQKGARRRKITCATASEPEDRNGLTHRRGEKGRLNFKLQGFWRAAGGDRSENGGSNLASQCQQWL